jgi:putative hemolysin
MTKFTSMFFMAMSIMIAACSPPVPEVPVQEVPAVPVDTVSSAPESTA